MPLLAIAVAIAETEAANVTAGDAVTLVAEAIGWGIAGGLVAGTVTAGALRISRKRTTGWRAIGPKSCPSSAPPARSGSPMSGEAAASSRAFVGGVVFGIVAGADANVAAFSEELGGVLNGLTLIVFGAAVLGPLWSQIGLVEVCYAVLSLTLVRIVPVAIVMVSKARSPTVLFLGWFGPRGLASIVFGVVVVEAAGLPHTSTLVVAVTVTVALSVVAHGVTAAPLVRRYAAWHAASNVVMESTPTPHQRWRHTLPTSP